MDEASGRNQETGIRNQEEGSIQASGRLYSLRILDFGLSVPLCLRGSESANCQLKWTGTSTTENWNGCYSRAPVNDFFQPALSVGEGRAEVRMAVRQEFFHAASAVHGAVYFKAMDDAAFFAANSLLREVFVLTVSFTVYLTRPVSKGEMKAVGQVVHQYAQAASGRGRTLRLARPPDRPGQRQFHAQPHPARFRGRLPLKEAKPQTGGRWG